MYVFAYLHAPCLHRQDTSSVRSITLLQTEREWMVLLLICLGIGVALESDLQEGWDLMLSKLAYIDSLSESAHSTIKHTSILQGKPTG